MLSLIPSAQSGALQYLDISDNLVNDQKKAVNAIEDFLSKAKNLKTLSISDSSL